MLPDLGHCNFISLVTPWVVCGWGSSVLLAFLQRRQRLGTQCVHKTQCVKKASSLMFRPSLWAIGMVQQVKVLAVNTWRSEFNLQIPQRHESSSIPHAYCGTHAHTPYTIMLITSERKYQDHCISASFETVTVSFCPISCVPPQEPGEHEQKSQEWVVT